MKKILILMVILTVCSCNSSTKKTTTDGKETTHTGSIHSTISTSKNVYIKGEAIELSLEVKNTGSKPYTFLPWGTPIENKFTGSCLHVTHNNKNINYKGIMVKRVPPTEKDYITLETGKTAVGKVNLLDGYELIEKGIYTIQFEKTFDGLPASNIINVEIK